MVVLQNRSTMAYMRKQGTPSRKNEGDVKRSSSFSNPSSLSPNSIAADESLVVEDGSENRFWGILARKAKAILDDENVSAPIESPLSAPAATAHSPTIAMTHHRNLSHGHDTSRLSKGLRSISTSADKTLQLQEGPTPRVNKATNIPRGSRAADILRERESPTPRRNGSPHERQSRTPRGIKVADIVHECQVGTPEGYKAADILHERQARSPTGIKASDILVGRKLQIRKKGNGCDGKGASPCADSSRHLGGMFSPQIQNPENQLKAARDVAMATAAKAKLLLRELKTVKADLAFAKERCGQLEEENKVLRSREKGANRHNTPADDDLIRLQLETLLAEKARLANENSTYARENRFLREIVEYHQLTMQDIVYLEEEDEDESGAEVSIHKVAKMLTVSPPSPSQDPLSIPPPQDVSPINISGDATTPSH